MEAEHLRDLSNICHAATYDRLDNTIQYYSVAKKYWTTESLWANSSAGYYVDTLGYWDIVSYNPDQYEIACEVVANSL